MIYIPAHGSHGHLQTLNKWYYTSCYIIPLRIDPTTYVSLDPVIHRELQNVIYMNKNINDQEKGGGSCPQVPVGYL
jgi:hypothetical protein